MPKIELERLLSKRSIASRKEAALLILEGKVKVNGKTCKRPLEFVDTRSKIEIENQEIAPAKKYYLMFNKPKGFVVTRSDEKNRPTIFQFLENWKGPLVQAVGRLDMASEGLLLLTNDHEWANKLMDPKTHVKKTYHVQVSPVPGDEVLLKLSNGIILEGKKTLPSTFKIIRTNNLNAWLSVELTEGKNRQIRKMLESEKIEVLRLVRIAIGPLLLGELEKGQWRELSKDEINSLS